jgi:hypothetical protein
MNRRNLLTLAFSIFFAVATHAQQNPAPKASPAPRVVAVKAGKVLDVRTGNYRSNQIIWIEGDRIKQIGDAATLDRNCRPARSASNFPVLPSSPG